MKKTKVSKKNENEIKVDNVEALDLPPKFFFEISNDISFYNENAYIEGLESCLKNLQFFFKMPKEKCFDCFRKNKYEICDAIKELSQESSILNFEKNSENLFSINEERKDQENEDKLTCGICAESKPSKEFFSLECCHKFCDECYKNYLNTSLESQGFLFLDNTVCPMENCKLKVDIDFFEKMFINHQNILSKIKNFMRLFILNTFPSHIKHCPSPCCNYIYKLPEELGSQEITIKCPNEHTFCHKCHLNPHYPFTCKENKYWFSENDVQFKQDYLWVYKHCKQCPKCGWNIQKNEGCNHMTCRLCNHEFCWLCFQNYHGHNDALCSKLTKEKQNQKTTLINTAKNFSQKKKLMQNLESFLEGRKKQETNFLKSLKHKKNKSEDMVENFKIMEEIDQFLFFASKIAFVFAPEEKEEKIIKSDRDSFLDRLLRLKNAAPNRIEMIKKTVINEDLKKYMRIVESKLEKLRKDQEIFTNFYNL